MFGWRAKVSLWGGVALVATTFVVWTSLHQQATHQASLREPVQRATTQIRLLADEADKGLIPLEQARQQARSIAQALPTDGHVRFWVSQRQGTPVVNEIEPGLQHIQPAEGTETAQVLQRILGTASVDGQFVSYDWPPRTAVARVAYVQKIHQWDWVIGASSDHLALASLLVERLGLLVIGLGLLGFTLRMVSTGSRNEMCR
ncbi:hypothetical protein JCM17960_07900 [Magnetospira thiophila]